MNLNDYQRKAFATAKINWESPDGRCVPLFGAIGELGSVASEFKKRLRDGKAYTKDKDGISAEFGDVLWYLATIASRLDLELEALIAKPKKQVGVATKAAPYIFDLAITIGNLASTLNSSGFSPKGGDLTRVKTDLGKALASTLHAIKLEKLDLEKVLRRNLRKVHGMFGTDRIKPARQFDAKVPIYEQLPRKIAIEFIEREKLGKDKKRVEVIIRANGINIGDRLTDNASKDDGYRFHDAFHLGYAAVLGWSPVVRSFLRCKRKSDSKADEVQDGARAAIIEEAVSQTVFDYARDHSMLSGLDRLDHGILQVIQRMVRGLEVQRVDLSEWQRAILVGYEAFRALKKNGGGWLLLDAENRSLTFSREEPVV